MPTSVPAFDFATLPKSARAALSSVPLVSERLNAQLRATLVAALPGETTATAALSALAPVDLAAVAKQSVRTFVFDQLQRSKDSAVHATAERVAAQLSDQITIAALLGLDQPLATHPVFQDLARRAQLDAFLSTSSTLPAAVREALVALWTAQKGSLADFWTAARQDPKLKGSIDELQFTFELVSLAGNWTPLVSSLQDLRRQGSVATLRDLTKLDVAAWKQLLQATGSALPSSLPGGTSALRIENLARRILSDLHARFPTAYLSSALKRASVADATLDPVATLLAQAPTIELLHTRLDDELAKLPAAAWNGVSDRAVASQALKHWQRLLHLTTDEQQMLALHRAGIDSAHCVAEMSEAAFTDRLATVIGLSEARAIHARARAVAGIIAHTALSVVQASRDPLPQSVGSELTTPPDWTTLFGGNSFCECEHCRSVLGPAAYFVDILQFLNPAVPPPSGLRPVDVLLRRRPDLARIPLTCANSDTPLPYADLINEVLESYIATGAPVAGDTDGATAEELAVTPENVYQVAYDKLLGAVYPLSLPFNRALEIQRAYLGYLGSSRAELLSDLIPYGQPVATPAVLESIGISFVELQILTNQPLSPPRVLEEFYGFAPGTSLVSALAPVPVLLQRVQISFADLTDLLATRFLDGDKRIGIQTAAASPCDVSQMTLTGLDSTFFDRLHRFLRLRARLGWSTFDLDRALAALGVAAIDDAALVALARLSRVVGRLGQPLGLVLSCIANLDGHQYDSQRDDSVYGSLFQNRRLFGPNEDAFKTFALDAAGTELLDTSPKIRSQSAALSAALRIGATDLAALTTVAGAPSLDDDLRLAHLSTLAGLATLARGLGLRPADLVSLLALSGATPLAASDPAPLAAFIDRVDAAVASGFTVPQLDYLIRDRTDPAGDPAAPSLDTVKRKLLAGLAPLEPGSIEAASFVKQTLTDALKLDGSLVALLVDRVLGAIEILPAPLPEPVLQDLLRLVGDGVSAHYFANPDFTGNSIQRIDPGIDFQWGDAAPDPSLTPNRFSVRWTGFALPLLDADYTFTLRARAGVQLWIDGTLLIDAANPPLSGEVSATVSLTGGRLHALRVDCSVNGPDPAVSLRWSSASMPDAVTPRPSLYSGHYFSDLEVLLSSYRRLFKLAMQISAFGLAVDEVDHFLGQLPAPTKPPAAPERFFAGWESVVRYVALRDSLPRGSVTLVDVLSSANSSPAATVLAQLSAATGWGLDQLQALVDSGAIGAAAFAQVDGLAWAASVMTLARRLGASTAQLIAWSAADVEAATGQSAADDLRRAVRSKLDDSSWDAVGTQLNDRLRERQRDALVAYLANDASLAPLIASGGVEALFEWFLIDVQMNACMMTSRIKQAICSVQLFVDRCLLGLELNVPAAAIDADTWSWKQQYRIWEANRKVFLYPENWIDPELRNDKTPFFQQLGAELRQNVLSSDSGEAAIVNYLTRLNDVSRLEIVAVYWERAAEPPLAVGATGQAVIDLQKLLDDAGAQPPLDITGKFDTATQVAVIIFQLNHGIVANGVVGEETWVALRGRPAVDVAHVVGRTHGTPQRYFYRRRAGALPWTPWQPINADLDGDCYLLTVWNRRLFLIWPTVTIPPNDAGIARPDQPFTVKLSWSTYENGAFLPKRQSSDLGPFRAAAGITPEDVSLSAEVDANGDLDVWLLWYPGGAPSGDSEFNLHIVNLRFTDFGQHVTVDLSQPHGGNTAVPLDSLVKSCRFRQNFDGLGFTPVEYDFNGNPLEVPALLASPSPFEIVCSNECLEHGPDNVSAPGLFDLSFIYQDDRRTYWVTNGFPLREQIGADTVLPPFAPDLLRPHPIRPANQSIRADDPLASGASPPPAATPKTTDSRPNPFFPTDEWVIFTYEVFFHPYATDFCRSLADGGVPALLTPASQLRTDRGLTLVNNYQPGYLRLFFPTFETVDFTSYGTYSIYNWELFFHIPILIATRLSADGQFADAQKWFHYVFNPLDRSSAPSPQRFWKVLPFARNNTQAQQIETLLRALDGQGTPDEQAEIKHELAAWLADPFNPFAIARTRLAAFQKFVVFKYLDNLIAWGDQLFRQDTIESINQATQLYVLAKQLLGPRPEQVPGRGEPAPQTYEQLRPLLDSFSNALVTLENQFPYVSELASGMPTSKEPAAGWQPFYFCVPANDQMLAYWDTVDDRLFKIRHCLDIQGVAQQLPLYEPPIDPMLLVRAKAYGVDLGSVVADLAAPPPLYRFPALIQKALELSGSVRSLGAALSSAIEKGDAEALTELRNQHETALLKSVRAGRVAQIAEAQTQIDAVKLSGEVVKARADYYSSRETTSELESEQLDHMDQANTFQEVAGVLELAAQIVSLIPQETLGVMPAGASGIPIPVFFMTTGGLNIGSAMAAAGRFINLLATDQAYQATRNGIIAQWTRRAQDWAMQADVANRELTQLAKVGDAAALRLTIAQNALVTHDLQIQHTQEVADFLRNKFSNADLFSWTITQLSTVYYQMYELAYSAARRAEAAYRYDRGLIASDYIQFGYWDSLRRGLLAGEQLELSLRRLEAAFLDGNQRELELIKDVSLVQLAPTALIALRETGQCRVTLPEALFDFDYPGHYLRRMRSVAVTIPCVVGPYSGVHCTLTLESSKIRAVPGIDGGYPEREGDSRFIYHPTVNHSIATSHAQQDTGLFGPDTENRYLPFEGQGAISSWLIELPRDTNNFDFDTITDLILRIGYTARDAGALVREAARQSLLPAPADPNPLQPGAKRPTQDGLMRLFSLKHEFSNEWYRFANPPADATTQSLTIDLGQGRFSLRDRVQQIAIGSIDVFAVFNRQLPVDPAAKYSAGPLRVAVTAPGGVVIPDPSGTGSPTLLESPAFGNAPLVRLALSQPIDPSTVGGGSWTLTVSSSDVAIMDPIFQKSVTINNQKVYRLNVEAITNLLIICHYSTSPR